MHFDDSDLEITKPTPAEATDIAFVIPLEKFVYKINDAWNISEPVGKEGIKNHLLATGWPADTVKLFLNSGGYLKVYGHALAPKKPPLFRDADGKRYINTWVPPTLQPAPGDYPRIRRVLEWVTKGDAEGIRYIKHWMAQKVQIQNLVPKVALVFSTEEGGGKGTLAYVMRAMLGLKNTAVIKSEELGNRFNSRWIGKLFVLGDEVLTNENVKDVSNMLKVLIDGNEIEIEGKGKDQRAIENQLSWMFASNDQIAPVVLGKNDRRYSFFSNHDPLPEDYKALLNSGFQADRKTPTAEFESEMAAFYHEMLNTEVDRAFVSKPYGNDDRDQLIEANFPTHTLFFKDVEQVGIKHHIEDMLFRAQDRHRLEKTREAWELKTPEGTAVNTQILYRCYVNYAKAVGARALKLNKFGSAAQNHRPAWKKVRKTMLGKQVNCYVVPPHEETQS